MEIVEKDMEDHGMVSERLVSGRRKNSGIVESSHMRFFLMHVDMVIS